MGKILFRNPRARFRPEEYGGIGKLGFQTVVLDHLAYATITNFCQPIAEEVAKEQCTEEVITSLLDVKFLLQIDATTAQSILAGERSNARE